MAGGLVTALGATYLRRAGGESSSLSTATLITPSVSFFKQLRNPLRSGAGVGVGDERFGIDLALLR